MQKKRLVRIVRGRTEPILVDAKAARAHLRWLSGRGVGLRTVAERTGVGRTALAQIRSGETRRVRPATEERILQVFPCDARPGAYVPAGPTWKLIDDLLSHGWTRMAIARELGSTARVPALQLRRDRVTAASAAKVRALHERALRAVIVDRENMAEARAMFRRRAAA